MKINYLKNNFKLSNLALSIYIKIKKKLDLNY